MVAREEGVVSMSTQRTLEELECAVYEACQQDDCDALEQCIGCLEASDSPKAAALACICTAQLLFVQGNYLSATEKYQKAKDLFERIADVRGTASALHGLGWCLLEVCLYDEAEEELLSALNLYEGLDIISLNARVKGDIARLYRCRGKHDTAIEWNEAALSLYQEQGKLAGVARILNNIGNVYREVHEVTLAQDYYHRALKYYSILNDMKGAALALNGIGVCYAEIGDFKEAHECLKKALIMKREQNDSKGIAQILSNIGEVEYLAGQQYNALLKFKEAVEIYHRTGDRRNEAQTLVQYSNVLNKAGRYDEAYLHIGNALKLLDNHDNVHIQVVLLVMAARALINMENLTEAYEQCFKALEYCTNGDDITDRFQVYELLGIIYHKAGDYPRAHSEYQRAIDGYRVIQRQSAEARVVRNVAELHIDIGDYEQARVQLDYALGLYEQLPENEQAHIYFVYYSLGAIMQRVGKCQLALDYYKKALNVCKGADRKQSEAYIMSAMANTYLNIDAIDQANSCVAMIPNQNRLRPSVNISVLQVKSRLAQCNGSTHDAISYLNQTLEIATKYGLKLEQADTQKLLRDLAQKNNDLAAYIEHNNEYTRLTEEINGKETAAKLAIQAKEQEIRAEREERERERAILYSTLPKSVADRMVKGETVSGDEYEHSAVLFTDIVNFTSHSSILSATQITEFLASIFTAFDKLCEQHSVTKVKTIGDSYMCFKGDGEADENANAIAQVALGITDASFTWPSPDGAENSIPDSVQFRVGIAIGPATAGVIGTDRLQYDVWGDTVNLASRMESTGEPGRIQVHEGIVEVLAQAPYTFISRGDVEVKGKGAIHTWWLEGGV